jgi:hypothetical protein
MVKMIFVGLGPTGEFPQGKATPDDEGALMVSISDDGEMVRVDFGTRIAWIGFGPQDAKQFADSIVKHASNCVTQKKDD